MNKIYGYFINGVLKKISFNKELLQEILMNDYYDEAFYQYNVLILCYRYSDKFNGLSPCDFWHQIKDKNSNLFNTRFSYRIIKDLEEYYIE